MRKKTAAKLAFAKFYDVCANIARYEKLKFSLHFKTRFKLLFGQ